MDQRLVWHYPHLHYFMGGAKFVLEVMGRLKKTFDVQLLCGGGHPEVLKKFDRSGVPVIRIASLSTHKILYWLFFPFFLLKDLFRSLPYLKQADHVIGGIYPSNLVCALYAALFHKKYYFYCYEPFPFFHHAEFMGKFPPLKTLLLKLLSFLYGWTDIWAAQKAAVIWTPDQYKASLIQKIYGVTPVITSVGIDMSVFRPYSPNRIADRFRDQLLVTHSTDYSPIKNTDLAILAIAELAPKHPSIRLLITSTQPDSPRKKIYEDLAQKLGVEKNVIFEGFIPTEELPLYYSASLCYLSTSTDEITAGNWPVKEALACGTPALRSAVLTHDVVDQVSGFIVDPHDPGSVAEKIELFITHPEKAKQMGAAGRKCIGENYSWDHVLNAIIRRL